jgi:16S rRNA (adenine1518-N6/adenine1519-N6)-dimethyltransferase
MGNGPFKIVANLPYSVGAAIVQHVLESDSDLVSATLMLQREVGERLVANPPNMSILSVATQTYALGFIGLDVPPDVFIPPPNVQSVVVQLIPHAEPLLSVNDRKSYFSLVNAGFRHKRKNIANSLELETRLPKSVVNQRLHAAHIDPTRRAQTLSIDEWLALHESWRAND